MNFLAIFIILASLVIIEECHCRIEKLGNKELIQSHVIFRHGERTTYRFYPTDPHINSTFYPIGLGGLTNNGKLGEYKLGLFLRNEYDSLLDDIYSERDIEVRSTDTVRTLMSAQLVLAGLYPPVGNQVWHSQLQWQPIPVFSKLKPEEDLLHPEVCPNKLAAYKNLSKRSEVHQLFIKPYEKLFKFVEEKSGMVIRNPHDLIEFYFIVNTEDDLHMSLPTWVREVYPDQIYPVASLTYNYLNVDDEIKKINSGYLMKKMIADMLKITADGQNDDVKKMYLYSGHESTLGYLLFVMNVLKPHIPSYGSAIMLDLFKDTSTDEYFVKLKYRDSPTSNIAVDLILPGCNGDRYCPLKKFTELQTYYLPTVSIQEACKLPEPALSSP